MLEDFSPVQVVWLRYSTAGLSFLFLSLVMHLKHKKSMFLWPKPKRDLFFLILMGALTYCYSPLLQITGLSYSKVSENALIVAIEPILTVFLAYLLFRERVESFEVLGFVLAMIGFGLLSGLSSEMLSFGVSGHLFGNFLILFSLLGEASFSVLGSQLARRYSPLSLFGTSLFLGIAFLTLSLGLFEKGVFQGSFWGSLLHQFSWRSFFALMWLGPFGTAGGYLYALQALSRASVVSVTLLLFVQPIGGVFLGAVFFQEKLNSDQLWGSAMIGLALLFSVVMRLKKRPND